jgi:hypothetical protein
MKMEWTECSETLAFKLQMPVNHPEESIQHNIELIDRSPLNYFCARLVNLVFLLLMWHRFI